MIDLRLYPRSPVETQVRVRIPGGYAHGKCVNMSTGGCLVETTGGLGLKKGQQVELRFIVRLKHYTSVHFRKATVVHITRGCIGFAIEYTPRPASPTAPPNRVA